MTNNEKNLCGFAMTAAIGAVIYQGLAMLVFLVDAGICYGSAVNAVNFVNFVIGLFYIKSATALTVLSRFGTAVVYAIIAVLLVKSFVEGVKTAIALKSGGISYRWAFSASQKQIGKTVSYLVTYTVITNWIYYYGVNGIMYALLICGAIMAVIMRSTWHLLSNTPSFSYTVPYIVKNIFIYLFLIIMLRFVCDPIIPDFINGFAIFSDMLSSAPVYALYEYCIRFIIVVFIGVNFMYVAYYAAFEQNDQENKIKAKSRILLILSVIILLLNNAAQTLFLDSSTQTMFSVELLKEWFSLSRTTTFPFMLLSVALLITASLIIEDNTKKTVIPSDKDEK